MTRDRHRPEEAGPSPFPLGDTVLVARAVEGLLMLRVYEHHNLHALQAVENFDAVVERIDLAATKATMMMRAVGIALPNDEAPPMVSAVDAHIRALVSEAYQELTGLLQEPIAETEGFASDDLFDVSVVALEPYDGRRIRVEIALVLA